MSKKKQRTSEHGAAASAVGGKTGSKNAPTPAAKGGRNPKVVWFTVGALALAAIAVVVVFATQGSKTGGPGGGGSFGVPPEEAKYMGRLLPASYVEPSIAGVTAYTSAVKMTTVTPAQSAGQVSVPVDQVISKKIVYFEYKRADGTALPVIAYLKPSGKVFVGVSFCPPCEGKGQRIETDLTLTCETCGTTRTLEDGVGVSGACKLYPLDELPAKVTDGKLVLDTAPLESWTAQPLDRKVGA